MTSTCLGNYQTYYTPIFVYYQALCNKMKYPFQRLIFRRSSFLVSFIF